MSSLSPKKTPASPVQRKPPQHQARNVQDGTPFQPATTPYDPDLQSMVLELQDGSAHQGFSFGAEKSIAGECVFQTGLFYFFFLFCYKYVLFFPNFVKQ